MRRAAAALAAAALPLAALALTGCSDDDAAKARAVYRDYQAAHDERIDAELRLRKAIFDLSAAAGRHDRASALAAVGRGKHAAAEIERIFAAEIDAAARLAAFADYRAVARRLEHGLRTSREGLLLVVRELTIGGRDPFLDRREGRAEVDRLARRSRRLAVEGARERR
ncbi:MAG: hypothetical protein M3327_15420, partial [Actinomycetota bacterium]|nr:hypothetical protein [Actinomycetota bacterium]